jgi:hypothetical protein
VVSAGGIDKPLLVVEATRGKIKISLILTAEDLGAHGARCIAPSIAEQIFPNLPDALEALLKEWRLGTRISSQQHGLGVIRGGRQ